MVPDQGLFNVRKEVFFPGNEYANHLQVLQNKIPWACFQQRLFSTALIARPVPKG
jgi:hypothetical protein